MNLPNVFEDKLKKKRQGQGNESRLEQVIAYGPDIKPREKIEGAQLIDIAPTVLHNVTGIPVPEDTDGRVLKEILGKESEPAQRAVEYEAAGTERQKVRDRVARLKMSDKI